MYLRLVRITLEPGARSAAQKLADEFVPAIKAQNGCNECVFFADDNSGDYGIVVLWNSKEDAEAAASVIGPRLAQAISEVSDEPADIRLFEVFETQSM